MPRPTESEKRARPTRDVAKGKIRVGEVEEEVDIEVETTPNAHGGYDTKVILPTCPLSAVRNN